MFWVGVFLIAFSTFHIRGLVSLSEKSLAFNFTLNLQKFKHSLASQTVRTMDPELREGSALLSFMWFEVAKRIVQKAIHIYECTPEQAEALKKVFLRSNDYFIQTI